MLPRLCHAWAGCSPSVAAEAHLDLLLVSVRFELDRVAVGQVCHRITSVVPCQYHYTNSIYLRSSTRCCYQKNKRAKRGDFPKIISLSETFGRIEPSLFIVLANADSSFLCRELGGNPTLTVSRDDYSVPTISGWSNLLVSYPTILVAFAELWKVAISFVPFALPHGASRLSLDGYEWNFICEHFSKMCRENSRFIKVWQK